MVPLWESGGIRIVISISRLVAGGGKLGWHLAFNCVVCSISNIYAIQFGGSVVIFFFFELRGKGTPEQKSQSYL